MGSRLIVVVMLPVLACSGGSTLPRTEVDCSQFSETTQPDAFTPPDQRTTIDWKTAAKMIIRRVYPKYPDLALRAGLEGTVDVKLWIGQDGIVKQAFVVKSNGEIFNESALDAARRLLFSPATCHGTVLSVWATIPIRFKIAK
ncbi:MAG TPA: energy transducer TonB [Bacteroidota bacterium]